jgi:hypothetical protein
MASSIVPDDVEAACFGGRGVIRRRVHDAELKARPAVGRRWLRGTREQLRRLAWHAFSRRLVVHGGSLFSAP